jgi:glutaredoxin-related protein
MRKILENEKLSPAAELAIRSFHSNTVDEVAKAIAENEWVIVGMAQNPVVKTARKHLQAKNIRFLYLEYGNYFSQWKRRLAIKLWSGWPTFPQVFHKGQLIGGNAELRKYLP